MVVNGFGFGGSFIFFLGVILEFVLCEIFDFKVV